MEIDKQMKNALSGSLSDLKESIEETAEESFDSIDGLDTLAKEIAKIMDSTSYEDELELSFCDKYYYISRDVDRPYYAFSPTVSRMIHIAPTTEVIIIDEYHFDTCKPAETVNCVTLHGLLLDLPRKHIIMMDLFMKLKNGVIILRMGNGFNILLMVI